MQESHLAAAITRVLGAQLVANGFAKASDSDSIRYERELRGHPNAIEFDHGNPDWNVRVVRFRLYAPKQPFGIEGATVSNGRLWWEYETDQDLILRLTEIRDILFSSGLQWLEMNTPGNVPEWRPLVKHSITPLMDTFGFTSSGIRESTIPDLIRYTHRSDPNTVVVLDFRHPGQVAVGLSTGIGQSAIRRFSPAFEYSNAEGLSVAVDRVRGFLEQEVPRLTSST